MTEPDLRPEVPPEPPAEPVSPAMDDEVGIDVPSVDNEQRVEILTLEEEPPSEAQAEEEYQDHAPAKKKREEIIRFESLTLAEALGELFASPAETWAKVRQVAHTPRYRVIPLADSASMGEIPNVLPSAPLDPSILNHDGSDPNDGSDENDAIALSVAEPPPTPEQPMLPPQQEALILGIRLSLVIVTWFGNATLIRVARAGDSPTFAIMLVLVGVLGWLATEVYASWGGIKAWWEARNAPKAVPNQAPTEEPAPAGSEPQWRGIHPLRVVLLIFGLLMMFATVAYTDNNQFTLIGVLTWIMSILAFSAAFANESTLFAQWRARRPVVSGQISFWRTGTFAALLFIVAVGAFFRLYDLPGTPPQMTSDHVEKILDAQRVLEGNLQVFFPNNGGREPLQMYLMALLSLFPGLGMNFTTLKLLSALEGIITIPLLWWMAREVVGTENRRLGNIVGLVLAALVAVSQWHVGLSRLALRIVLTPLITTAVLVFLGRGMRTNNRDEFIRAGLLLGAGLYMYQAVRMLPVVVFAAVLVAIIAYARNWRTLWRYSFNFFTVGVISFVVFVPLLNFSLQYPQLFWMRTAGRLLGDSIIQEEDANGNMVRRDATVEEQQEALQANLTIFQSNLGNALLMFNWRGDVAWINNAPNVPHLDAITGAFFLLGLAAWLARMFRRRDPVDWLIPMTAFIMILPSALAIAYPIENPSMTRSSGAIPAVYLMAALPLALMAYSAGRVFPRRVGVVFGTGAVGLVMLIAYTQNANTYFNGYHNNYLLSSLPYAQAGRDMASFNTEVGTVGNSFMIAYPYWWDHRALGLAAGMVNYPHGIVTLADVPAFLYSAYSRLDRFKLDPSRDLLFFFAAEDTAALEQLREWFPNGRYEFVDVREQNRSYGLYRVPALGQDGFLLFALEYAEVQTGE